MSQNRPFLKNWKWRKLGDITTERLIGLVRNSKEQNDSHLCSYLKMDSIRTNGNLNLNLATKVNATPEEIDRYSLQNGDFLFNTRNSYELVGKTAVFESKEKQWLYNNNIMRIRFNEDINPWFVNIAFQSNLVKRQLNAAKNKTTSVCAIYDYHLVEIEIPIPPFDEQSRIVEIFKKVDRVRRKRQEAIRLTEELGRSLFLHMFSKYFETKYLQTFEDVSEVLIDCRNKTAPYADEGIPLIRTTNFKNYRLDLSELKYITQQTNQIWSSRHQTAPGDIVYCREAPYGMAATVPSEFYPCLGQRIMVSRPNQSKVSTEFLLFALNSSFVYRQALKVAIGSTVKHLRVVDVKGLNIPVAPLNEQKQFQQILYRCEQSWSNQILQKSDSENLFNSLLQRAFRGEL